MSNDFDFDTPTQQTQRIDFKKIYFNPQEGLNPLRIIELGGKKFPSHYCFVKAAQKKKYVKCPGAGCPLCIDSNNYSITTRYYMKIIDRKSNEIRVWEFGKQIKTLIKELVDDIKARVKSGETDANDSLTEYNIDVRRRPAGTNPLYSISVKERVTTDSRFKNVVDNDAKIIAADTINLEDLIKPWSVERIKTQVLGEDVPKSVGGGVSAPATVARVATVKPVTAPGATVAPVATVTRPDVKELSKKASDLGSEDDDWLND